MENFSGESFVPKDGCSLVSSRYQALLELARNLGSHRCAEDAFRYAPRELHSTIDAGIIAVIASGGSLRPSWFASDREGRDQRLEFAPAALENCICSLGQLQEPVIFGDLEQAAGLDGIIEQFRKTGNCSLCVLPLHTALRQLGWLIIGRSQQDAFDAEDFQFLRLVAQHAALAIDDSLNYASSQRAHTQLESERTRLKFLLDLNDSVVSTLELRRLLQAISPNIRKMMRLDAVALILPDSEEVQLRIYALDFPGNKGIIREDMRSPEDGIVGEVFRRGRAWSGFVDEIPRSEVNTTFAQGERLKTVCFLPLARGGKVLGVLCLARTREDAFQDGDLEFAGQIASQIAIAIDNALVYGQIAELKEKLTQEKLYFEDELRSEMHFEEIIGNSPVLLQVLRQIETVAPTESTVLIFGETGSGKELIARAVHNLSRRRSAAFVKLNCAAIPTGLLESELFGHEKGAFTGAIARRIGRFELASEGTIFLDEIGEIPLELQPKLLRVLQEREFERLGGSHTQRTNARLIAATNRDLGEMVEGGRFRSDLFYRLNVFPVRVPSLRERAEDIPVLVRHFAQHFARNMGKRIDAISSESLRALTRYSWPGNIRELQNVIERAVILSTGPTLRVPLGDLKKPSRLSGLPAEGHLTLEEAERRHIIGVLEQTNWVCAGPHGAAARLGMKRSTLQFRMRKLGIARPLARAASGGDA